ncbi:DUF1489 family protein [Xanthobacter agilis]|jgi:hypothetical protein|uniref:Lysophospholipase n=1 Tax=Xanthobacter agilis TaxID=47492 RepID=A0ABU0LB22_XANAG|nr:DUF1489 domain-containing protein [Xanthobacter agilis]MDQ0504342.1 hypothetical protein [Xanthobacter agilis]
MSLHLIKLCVGATSIEDLRNWIADRRDDARRAGVPFEQTHVTRMVPTRMDELRDGGSLYWVIRGDVAARQRLLDVRPFVDVDGVRRCALVLDPEVIGVRPRPARPFQGWRYLKPAEAPADLAAVDGDAAAAMPEEMRRELEMLGLL